MTNPNYDDRIIVIDSYPGAGKTSFMIQHINELPKDQRVIYITPFLTEVKRVINSCPTKRFRQPERNGYGSKLTDLRELIEQETNIVSTHALFTEITDPMISLLKSKNYILCLDEVFQAVNKISTKNTKKVFSSSGFKFDDIEEETKDAITKKDINTLREKGIITVAEDYQISWAENSYLSQYEEMRKLANRNLLYLIDGNLLLWTFPISVFREDVFKKIYILTHRFDTQLQSYYYRYFKVDYAKYHILQDDNKRYSIIKTTEENDIEKDWKNRIKNLIEIVDNPKLNAIGDYYGMSRGRTYTSALSKKWYTNKNNKQYYPVIQRSIANFFNNISGSKADERMWTCFKFTINDLVSKNVSDTSWIPMNSRSTNDWGTRKFLAFPVNRYLDPNYTKFFKKKIITVDQDAFAISDCLQWIWRSRIRNFQNILIYIPSRRMRELVAGYLYD
jgi:hypothetical protein